MGAGNGVTDAVELGERLRPGGSLRGLTYDQLLLRGADADADAEQVGTTINLAAMPTRTQERGPLPAP